MFSTWKISKTARCLRVRDRSLLLLPCYRAKFLLNTVAGKSPCVEVMQSVAHLQSENSDSNSEAEVNVTDHDETVCVITGHVPGPIVASGRQSLA